MLVIKWGELPTPESPLCLLILESFCLFLKLHLFIGRGYSHVEVCMWRAESNLQESSPSGLYLLSHLIGPQSVFSGKMETAAALSPAWIHILGISRN